MESKSAEDPVKDVPEAAAEAELKEKKDEKKESPVEEKPTAGADSESAVGDSATATTADKEESVEKEPRPAEEKTDDALVGAEEETKTDAEASGKVESVVVAAASPRQEDEPEEKFEDAVDSEDTLTGKETAEPLKTSQSDPILDSVPSSSSLKSSSAESLPSCGVTESYEIEDSPEKSPKRTSSVVGKARPGPSSAVRQLPAIKSPDIETVDLDDDDDDEYDDEEVATAAAVRDDYNDQQYDFEEEDDDDDYYEDPESDDQDVSRVIKGANDELNTMDDAESGEDDKMDVSSDEDDYSEDDDDQPSVVVPKSVLSGKRKRDDDYSEEEVYDHDDDVDEPEEDEDDDDVEEVIELDDSECARKVPVSMGQISVEDESDEDVVRAEKKTSRKVKYKSYRQKVMARIWRRTYKLLNKRSMHVMEEGSDALVCSDATKIVSLKSTVSSVGAKTTTIAEEVSIKDPKSKEDHSITPCEVERKDNSEEAVVASGDAAKVVSECKKDDENKENMTVKDNSKEVPRRVEVDEKAKVKDDEKPDRKDRKQGQSEEDDLTEDVMDSIDDIVADAKKQNGAKSDFNEELTFQMDVDESEKDYEEDEDEHEDDEDDEDREEEGAVDLSSSYDAYKSDRQTDDSDAIEMIDSSPEKDSSVVDIKPIRKPEPLQLDKSPSNSPEKLTAVKQEVEDDSDTVPEASVSARKSSSSREENQPEKPREAETVSRKRRRSVDPDDRDEDDEPLVPSKKLKRELESNYPTHDRLLKEYIETTSNHSVGDIQKHTDALMVEIQTLNEMIRAKEIEWNNMIHLKKVKEEILLRLTRKKHVMDVMQTKLGEVSEYTHFDSSNLTNVRSASVGPRPPTPPPEVDIRPASVTPLHSSTLNTSKNANVSTNSISGSRQLPGGKDNSLFAQFNHSNSSVTMVPLSTSSSSLITSTNTILQSRANMKSSEVAKEKPNAAQIQRQILPKPILSNHQQILNNLAMSAGLTAAGAPSSGATSISTSSTSATVANAANILAGLSNNILAHTAALLNGHHNPSGSNHLTQSQVNQLQVGRQGVIKDVKSIIADYRQKHPEQVPRRGRRLKNIPSSGYEGITITNKSGSSRMPELGYLLAENSRPSSNDSSQSNSNNHLTTVAGALSTSPTSAGFSINDVLAQFAKMSQTDRNLLSNLGAAAAAAAAAAAVSSNATATSSTTTHSSSSSRQQQQQQSRQNSAAANLSKNSYPEVTLHPVMNSTAGSGSNADMNHSTGSNASAANQSHSNNNSTNSLLHGILTKSSSRLNPSGFTSFSPTLARLLTAPERMNSQAATVTSGALANLQANTGLNLSKSNSEITITPVVASNLQQSLMAHQQQLQEQQKQLQRLREQHFMNMDDEADDSVDRLVIDEGDDHHGTANNSRNDGHRESSGVVITARGGNGPEFHENDVPECQGCKKREAQFVCAGCGNQWYCSRECQVNAWDDHSEVCTG